MKKSKILNGYELEPMDDFIRHNEWWVKSLADDSMDRQDRDFMDEMTMKAGVLFTHHTVNQVFLSRQRTGQSIIQTIKTARKIFRMKGRWGLFIHRDHRAYSSGRKQAAEHTIEIAERAMPYLRIWMMPLVWWRFGAVLIVRKNDLCRVSR